MADNDFNQTMALLTSVYAGNYAFYSNAAATAAAAAARGSNGAFLPPLPNNMPFLSPSTTDSMSPGNSPGAHNLVKSQSNGHSANTNFSIDGILGKPDPRFGLGSSSLFSLDKDLLDKHLGKAYEGFIPDETDLNSRFSWLQCTRYKPPKLPRVKRKDAIKKRKLGRNPRVPFTQHQVTTLEAKFRRTHYLSSVDVAELSAALNLTETRVKIWFQNRRARERRDRETSPLAVASASATSSSMATSSPCSTQQQRMNSTTSTASSSWPAPAPPNPSAVAQFSHALQQGVSAFTPVSFGGF